MLFFLRYFSNSLLTKVSWFFVPVVQESKDMLYCKSAD